MIPDLRPQLTAAAAWTDRLVATVAPDQLGLPTPCDEMDVAALLAHLHAVRLRTLAYATDRAVGETPFSVPLEGDPSGLAATLGDLTTRSREAWAAWTPDELGTLTVDAPFGTVPGAAAVGIMGAEHLVHGWDLAVATGQDPEADPAVAEALLAVMQRSLPPAGAREGMPFADPVEPPADAGPTARLAHWTGRGARP